MKTPYKNAEGLFSGSDTGLLCALLKINNKKQLYSGAFIDAVFEIFCVSEAVKILSTAGKENTLFFLRINKGMEIDLMIETSSGFNLVEFKSGMSVKNNAANNINKLKKGFEKIKFNKSFIVSLNDSSYNFRNNILACGAADFFKTLSENS